LSNFRINTFRSQNRFSFTKNIFRYGKVEYHEADHSVKSAGDNRASRDVYIAQAEEIDPMLQRYKPELIDAAAKGDIKKLWAIFGVCCVFIVAEVVGGLIAGSLAILSDAVHLASDLCGFVFSIVAINLSMMDATVVYTYGYARAQILGALTSTLLIIVLSIWLAYEAIDRLVVGVQPIQCWFMFGTAVFGLCCNLTMFKVLHSHGPPHDHDHGHGHSHDHGDAHDHGNGPEKEHKHENAEKVFPLKTKQIRIKQMNMHMLKMATIMAPRSLPVNFPP
jgi:Co/Zn/Cd efflux system component